MLNVTGFFDMHMHSSPAPFERIGDSAEIALWCAEAGMGGLVIKSHFESTISKVHHARVAVREVYPEFQLFAGIALNRGVGGVNPGSVEIALEQHAKIVWLPTFDSENHVKTFGSAGTYGFKGMTFDSKRRRKGSESFTVLDVNGKLSDQTKEIVQMVLDYNVVLATGHISRAEIMAVVEYALGIGVEKLVITHPEFLVPNLDLPTMKELSESGVYMEFCAVNCFPMLDTVTLSELVEMISEVTPDRAVLASDSGQPWSARPPETLRVFAQSLFEKGVSSDAIRKMTIDNPKKLLGVV